MTFDLSYVLPIAWLGWILVSILVTARHWKRLLAAIIGWLVTIEIVGILSPIVTQALRHLPVPYEIGMGFAMLPYIILMGILLRIFRKRADGKRDTEQDAAGQPPPAGSLK